MQLGTDSNLREALELLLALGLGAIVGLERRLRGHPAGLHTNALVSLGSAAFVVAGISLGGDLSRVAAQVVTGSGFICAGVILHQGTDIRGLNTAATLWCTSALGVLAAVDRPLLACIVAGVTLLTNVALHYVEHVILKITAENS
ncbi:MAG: MgtC/SapB family protein [Pseudomonadota bacterium]|nr:MgtC/SapB family protein [Pseudomonadota bacterium]